MAAERVKGRGYIAHSRSGGRKITHIVVAVVDVFTAARGGGGCTWGSQGVCPATSTSVWCAALGPQPVWHADPGHSDVEEP